MIIKMKKTKRIFSMLLSIILAVFSILSHTTMIKAEGKEGFQDENVRLTYEIVHLWEGGYQAELKLENISDSVINSWKINMMSSDIINDLWGADLQLSENEHASVYEITAFSYNNQIKPGEYVSIGYIANGNGENINEFNVQYQKEEEQKSISENNVYVYDDYTVNYLITDIWEGNCNVKVEITNTSDEVIHNWGLRYLCADTISDLYGASDVAEGRVHIFRNLEYNQDIAIGETVTYGYTQSYETAADLPEAFEIISTKQLVDASDYEIEMIISDAWDNQMQAELVISNTGTEVIEDWNLSAVSNFDVISIWNGELVTGQAGKLEIHNAGYTQNINPGESIFVGLIISCDSEPNLENIVLYNINNKVWEQTDELEIILVDLENNVVAVNEVTKNRITIQTKGATNAEIRVYRNVDDAWELVDQLYDDGNITVHFDEIPNDGIFNNSITMLALEEGEMLYKAEVVKDNVVYDSAEFTINAVEKLSDEEFAEFNQQMSEINQTIVECIESNGYEYGSGADEIVRELENIYGNDVSVSGIELINGNTFKITFSNGLSFYFQISSTEDMDTMLRGGGVPAESRRYVVRENEGVNTGIPIAAVKSNRILLWAPFDTAWGDHDENAVTDEIIALSAYHNSYERITDEQADVNSLKEICNYGLVILATHGINGEWIVTGECVTANNNHSLELASGEISICVIYDPYTKTRQSLYMVNDQWLRSNINGTFPDSIIINNSCESSKTTAIWDALSAHGARTYYGYNGAVTNKYIMFGYGYLLENLLLEGMTTETSFEITLDAYYGGGSMEIYGQGNLIMPFSMNNGTFEDQLSGWSYAGDCRALTKLGNIEPTEGNYMASISTGVGYHMVEGAIWQECYIPEEATKLSVDWNFLSAEFLEYIGSKYDDPFTISVSVLEEGQENVIGKYSVNSLAEEYAADRTSAGRLICVSPEITLNNCSDIWMTGWISTEFDISAYAGEYVTLKFSVANAADTSYPTLVLIDNIHTDVQYSFSTDNIPVSDSIAADVVRTVTPNDHGRSYVIYTEEFNKDGQADGAIQFIQYAYGYVDQNQITATCVSTEQEFLDAWTVMEPGEGDEEIDEVRIIMHGNYYALIIDSKTGENLTVSPDGMVNSDPECIIISDLPEKSIYKIDIYACNTGLLDAINIDFDRVSMGTTVHITGNVAQAFLYSQDVRIVSAWDGSVVPLENGNARLSRKQESYYEFLDELESYCIIEPVRNNYSNPLLWRLIVSHDYDFRHNDPVGEVTYMRTSSGDYICSYKYNYQVNSITDEYIDYNIMNIDLMTGDMEETLLYRAPILHI
ncbi:MAG: cellulose binding domain-containing protein [Lachnospiraceae bacterium]|nr:cellulose binding domain-containing protein [Lachnospiraceae bacterium]